ncbi:hypothetical protein ACTMU2_18250 [Cupriavidus basilensis]
MQNHINIGSGEEYSIADLAAMVKRAVGYQGNIETDPAKPDGTPRKLLDNSLLKALGWRPKSASRKDFASHTRISSPRWRARTRARKVPFANSF